MPDVKAGLTSVGAEPVGNTPNEFALVLKEETERWGRVIRDASIRIE
jgi:tripartite-type tricarboxylate transporter receptor subunit TctC